MGPGLMPAGLAARPHAAKSSETDTGEAETGPQIPSNPCSNPKNPSKKHVERPTL